VDKIYSFFVFDLEIIWLYVPIACESGGFFISAILCDYFSLDD